MGRGYSAYTAIRHAEVRSIHKRRVAELGEMAVHTSKDYFVDYVFEELKRINKEYSKVRIRQILNMPQKEILLKENLD